MLWVNVLYFIQHHCMFILFCWDSVSTFPVQCLLCPERELHRIQLACEFCSRWFTVLQRLQCEREWMSLHNVYGACDRLYEIRQRSVLLFQVAFQLALICSLIGQPDTGLTGEVLCSPGGFMFLCLCYTVQTSHLDIILLPFPQASSLWKWKLFL